MSQKVSELTAIVPADVAAGDLLYIVDVSAGASGSKKIVLSKALEALGLVADTSPSLPALLRPPSLADASAPTNSVYYSTDSTALVYKDAGGVVHDLY